MTRVDRYGNTLATESEAARDAYVAGVDLFLAAAHGAEEQFAKCTAADPEFALGHAGLARARMMASDMAGAKTAMARAVASTLR